MSAPTDATISEAFTPAAAPRRVLIYAPLAYSTPHFETDLEIAQRHLDLGDNVELGSDAAQVGKRNITAGDPEGAAGQENLTALAQGDAAVHAGRSGGTGPSSGAPLPTLAVPTSPIAQMRVGFGPAGDGVEGGVCQGKLLPTG